MGVCSSATLSISRPGAAALIAPDALRSDEEVAAGGRQRSDSTEAGFIEQLLMSLENAERAQDSNDLTDKAHGSDSLELPWRHFARGMLIGCGVIAVPMAVLIWMVVSNGILYRLYPLPASAG